MDATPEKQLTPVVSQDLETARNSSIDPDALKLAEMGKPNLHIRIACEAITDFVHQPSGYTQDMSRNFSVWSVLGVGFSLTNSWFGISAALITGINSGGPLLIIYGSTLLRLYILVTCDIH